MIDYYNVLNIPPDADSVQIKTAYRRLALINHPDRSNSPDAAQKFIEIHEAYEVLINPLSRESYDNWYASYFAEQSEERLSQVRDASTRGKKKAENYSQINYDEFLNRIIDEFKVGIGYTPNFMFILFCLIGTGVGLWMIVEVNPLLGFFILAMYGTLCYFLFDRAKKDYIAERRHKIINQYK